MLISVTQTGVALNRISTYLDEDEVDEQVSTLKKQGDGPSEEIAPGLGVHQGTFKWNEVEEVKDKKKDTHEPSTSNGESDDASTVVDSASVAESETSDRRFQLTDISVMFPEGELTVVTGPTASGKTALLVSIHGAEGLRGLFIMSCTDDTSW